MKHLRRLGIVLAAAALASATSCAQMAPPPADDPKPPSRGEALFTWTGMVQGAVLLSYGPNGFGVGRTRDARLRQAKLRRYGGMPAVPGTCYLQEMGTPGGRVQIQSQPSPDNGFSCVVLIDETSEEPRAHAFTLFFVASAE